MRCLKATARPGKGWVTHGRRWPRPSRRNDDAGRGRCRAGSDAEGCGRRGFHPGALQGRSEEHTSELQSLMRISYAVFCLKKKKIISTQIQNIRQTLKKTKKCSTSPKYRQSR